MNDESNSSHDDGGDDYLQHIKTPLNACSLETLSDAPCSNRRNGSTEIWPLMVGCYELNPETNVRAGHLDLYAVAKDRNPIYLGDPLSVLQSSDGTSGILDGKWCPQSSQMLYATAHATGEIQLQHVHFRETDENDTSSFPLKTCKIGESAKLQDDDALCLALSWDFHRHDDDNIQSSWHRRMISSYSNGRVAIHNVHLQDNGSSSADFEEVESWAAHKMFTSPAEVWAACFTSHEQIVMSGGDEGQCKIWDLRLEKKRPIHSISFDAGVTVLSPHPRKEYWLACGSYDETVAILDLRMISSDQGPRTLCHSDPLGGGIWRIKWHPNNNYRLLLGAMHGGCRVVDLQVEGSNVDDKESIVLVHQEFTRHKSMAYGADWLVDSKPERSVEAAASCSFYDKALFLWNVV